MRLMKGTYGTIQKQASRIWNKTFRGAVWTEALTAYATLSTDQS
jgi:hypothetical protein